MRPLLIVVAALLSVLLGSPKFAGGQTRPGVTGQIAADLRSRNFEQALELSRSALRDSPNDPQLLAMEALALSGLGKDHEALASYNSALRLSPDYLPALEGAAQIEYNAGSKHAIVLLNRILEIRPDDPTSHAMLGVLAYKARDCKNAIRHFRASGNVLFSQQVALQEYAYCLIQDGQLSDAVKVYTDLLSSSPQDDRARIHLAAAQFLTGQPQGVLDTLDPILREAQPEPRALDIASNACEKLGDTPRAVEFLRRAIVQNPANVNYYLDFATLAFDHSSFQVGIDMLDAGLKRLPRAAPLYLARGILYIQLALYERGEADFETAERLDPRQAFSSESESLAKIQHTGAGDALATVRSRLKQHPDDPILLYLFADALTQNGAIPGTPQFTEALHSAERSVQIRPDLVLARDLLSKLYYDGHHLPQAIEQCRSALRLEPSDQEALYRLTQALRKTGNTREIPELLKRLASLREKDRKKQADENRYKLVEPETLSGQPRR